MTNVVRVQKVSVVREGLRTGKRVGALWSVLVCGLAASPALAVDPWADEVISFAPGVGAGSAYTTPGTVLGSPERYTGEGVFPGSVTPFNSPFGSDELYSIGVGGQITVRFAEPVTNDPLNPYGIDLLVFGNSFFYDPVNFDARADVIGADGGTIEVSVDGILWHTVPTTLADGLFPTLGYLDETSPFGGPAGNVPSDFTKPVNPAFAWNGLGLSGLIAGYDGSGGGAGVDIGALGLSSISYVRVSYAGGLGANVEIDAFSDVSPVPTPGVVALGGVAALAGLRRGRSGRKQG